MANLSCANDGEIARYDLVVFRNQWYCDADTDTQLSQSEVLSYVDGQQVNLGAGSQVGSNAILTEPSGCTDAQDSAMVSTMQLLLMGVWR